MTRTTAKAKTKVSDSTLAKWGRAYKEAKAREAAAKADAEEMAGKVIPVLTERGTKALETAGVRINKVAGEQTEYDYDAMQEVLGKRRYQKATKRVVNTDALASMLNAGEITQEELARFATVTPKKPYINVTFVAES